jgi:hypothetical protein
MLENLAAAPRTRKLVWAVMVHQEHGNWVMGGVSSKQRLQVGLLLLQHREQRNLGDW